MKKKEVAQLAIAGVIFVVAGVVAFGQLGGGSKKKLTAIIEIVKPLSVEFDQNSLRALSDPSKTRDFVVVPDIATGLNNPRPFGPF